MSAPVRVGIIGTGGWAGHHAAEFAAVENASVTACLDIDQARAAAFAAKFEIPCVAGSLDELLDEVDAVSIVTADRFHAPYTIKALQAGKHVMCEKPLTTTLKTSVSDG